MQMCVIERINMRDQIKSQSVGRGGVKQTSCFQQIHRIGSDSAARAYGRIAWKVTRRKYRKEISTW